MENNMTQLTSKSYYSAISEDMTVKKAVSYLEEGLKIRSLKDIFEKYYKGSNLRMILTEGILNLHPEKNRETVERNIRNWLNTKNRITLSKIVAIELCFILDLDFEKADEFVAYASGEKLHWRNPEEAVYIFAISHKLSYFKAKELLKKLSGAISKISGGTTNNKKRSAELTESEKPLQVNTLLVKQDILNLQNEDELVSYISDEYRNFGYFHNTAYSAFTEMMQKLSNIPGYEFTDIKDEHLSVRDILREYFYSSVFSDKSNNKENTDEKNNKYDNIDIIKNVISSNWPDESTLSKMKNREIDVSRKTLTLLFIATCDWDSDDPDYIPTKDELFSDIYNRINDFLIICGYPHLDPRSPFDWLIIYSICVPDLYCIDKKMGNMLKEMFETDGN